MSYLDLDQRGGADSHRARPAVLAALSPAVCATVRSPPAQHGWPAGSTTRRWLLLRHGAGQARSAAGLADPSEVVRARAAPAGRGSRGQPDDLAGGGGCGRHSQEGTPLRWHCIGGRRR
ncbi:hypothetical protein PVAP13_6KG285612 [Panicum virgatum]|uniref:Uncharacterized protein n=1 Tax=Panicum virgatum TaxID=38727 RepID=A0A8T0RHU1_PANVG|nr:hypothetical protein PVAP13_6KG285612 [Panicum virgatum]